MEEKKPPVTHIDEQLLREMILIEFSDLLPTECYEIKKDEKEVSPTGEFLSERSERNQRIAGDEHNRT